MRLYLEGTLQINTAGTGLLNPLMPMNSLQLSMQVPTHLVKLIMPTSVSADFLPVMSVRDAYLLCISAPSDLSARGLSDYPLHIPTAYE